MCCLLPSAGVGRVQGLDLAVRQASWNTFGMAILPGIGSGIVWHPVSPACALEAVHLLLLEAHIQLSPEPVLFRVGRQDHDTASKGQGAILTWRAHVLILTLEDSLA